MECEWENMAKYDVTFLCGHTETVELVGYEKEKEDSGTCPAQNYAGTVTKRGQQKNRYMLALSHFLI